MEWDQGQAGPENTELLRGPGRILLDEIPRPSWLLSAAWLDLNTSRIKSIHRRSHAGEGQAGGFGCSQDGLSLTFCLEWPFRFTASTLIQAGKQTGPSNPGKKKQLALLLQGISPISAQSSFRARLRSLGLRVTSGWSPGIWEARGFCLQTLSSQKTSCWAPHFSLDIFDTIPLELLLC